MTSTRPTTQPRAAPSVVKAARKARNHQSEAFQAWNASDWWLRALRAALTTEGAARGCVVGRVDVIVPA